MNHQKIPINFVYPKIKDTDFRFGSRQLQGIPLRANGDWRDYTPPSELQNRKRVESSACYVEASQHAIATIQEEQFGAPDNNYSARFNALLSEGTPQGGDPIVGGDSIRHDGLISETTLPFENINSWEEYHSFKGANENECRREGKNWLVQWKPEYDIVITRHESVAVKYAKLKEALNYSPVPISVTAWYEKDGVYVKPEGERDNHLVECVYVDKENHPWVWDTYPPFLKKLAPYYNFEFGMRWNLTKLDGKKNWCVGLLKELTSFFKDCVSAQRG